MSYTTNGTGAIQAQLNRLQQRLSRLEAQAGGGEQLAPNYLTLTNGLVGANFTGLINALGLIIPSAPTLTPGTSNEITWQRAADGAGVATMAAASPAANQTDLTINAGDPSTDTGAAIDITAKSESGNAALSIFSSGSGFLGMAVSATVGPENVVIIDEDGDSSFLQLADGTAQVAIDYGANNTGAGASVTFNHRIGRVPQAVLALPFANAVGFGGSSTTTITINASAVGTSFYWLAIG